MSWITIGISGISCSGKTTLAKSLHGLLSDPLKNKNIFPKNIEIGKVELCSQDSYIYPMDSPNHQWIKELNHINREYMSAIDMDQMCAYLLRIKDTNKDYTKSSEATTLNILIIEGYLIFNHPVTRDLCNIRICLSITFDECLGRRKMRVYKQPTPAGYVEQYVWPIYMKHLDEYKHMTDLLILNGADTKANCLANSLEFIKKIV